MFQYVRADFRRVWDSNPTYSAPRRFLSSFLQYGFLALLVYRYGRWAKSIHIPLAGHLLRSIYLVLQTLTEILFGISIDINSVIGPGLYIGHFGCIVVHGSMGERCSIGQGVTIGSKGAGKSNGWPAIGDRVYVGAGAKIIGAIRVGNDVVIGANAVVIEDVPDMHRAVGVPACTSLRSPTKP